MSPDYDTAGNMIAMPQAESETDRLFAVYDGWNRLTKVYADTDADDVFEPTTDDDLIATYEHDGLNRRIEKHVTAEGGGARAVDYFYNENWQLLESQTLIDTVTSTDQYIWDVTYIDAPIARYHDATSDGTYETVHYYTFDANQNITAAIEPDGTIAARYTYTPYGSPTAHDANWNNGATPTTDGPLYAGYHYDTETNLYHVRNRNYHPTLGSFIQRDPIGYAAGDVNLYRYVTNSPTVYTDSSGLKTLLPNRESDEAHAYVDKYIKRAKEDKREFSKAFERAVRKIMALNEAAENSEQPAQGQIQVPWGKSIAFDPNCPYVGVDLEEELLAIEQAANSYYDAQGMALTMFAKKKLPDSIILPIYRMTNLADVSGYGVAMHMYADPIVLERLMVASLGVGSVLADRDETLGNVMTTLTWIDRATTTVAIATGVGGCIYQAGQVGGKFVLSRAAKASVGLLTKQAVRMGGAYAVGCAVENLARRAGASPERMQQIQTAVNLVQTLVAARRVCFMAGTPVLVPAVVDDRVIDSVAEVAAAEDEPRHEWLLATGAVVVGVAGCLVREREDRREMERRQILITCPDTSVGRCPDEPADEEEPAVAGELPGSGPCVEPAERVVVSRKTPTRRGRLRLALCLLAAGLFGGLALWKAGPVESKVPPPTSAAVAVDTRNIETIRVGQRVLADNPEESEVEPVADTAVDAATWRLVRLKAEEPGEDGTLGIVEIEALLPPKWIAEHKAEVGAIAPAPIGLHDMDLSEGLMATVMAVEPCPPIQSGPGRVVLTTVSRLTNTVCELSVQNASGAEETVFATASHKFYSQNRATWVTTEELTPGEQLHGHTGPLTVVAVRPVPGTHRVYNIEVEGEHVYYVSPLGLLAHNACPGGIPKNVKPRKPTHTEATSGNQARKAARGQAQVGRESRGARQMAIEEKGGPGRASTSHKGKYYRHDPHPDAGTATDPGWHGKKHYHVTSPSGVKTVVSYD